VNVVIDANVLIAANRRDTHADLACAAACARVLLDAADGHVVLEDTSDLAWAEYKNYCNFSGQPGPGDRFFVWFARNRWTPGRVRRVDIGKDHEEMRESLPADLRAFDLSDHKWIAIYMGGDGKVLYNALDSDWSEHADALLKAGINVTELCWHHIQAV
jgi:hypothetical protein